MPFVTSFQLSCHAVSKLPTAMFCILFSLYCCARYGRFQAICRARYFHAAFFFAFRQAAFSAFSSAIFFESFIFFRLIIFSFSRLSLSVYLIFFFFRPLSVFLRLRRRHAAAISSPFLLSFFIFSSSFVCELIFAFHFRLRR